MAFVIVRGLQRTALFFISLFGVGEGGGADPCKKGYHPILGKQKSPQTIYVVVDLFCLHYNFSKMADVQKKKN